MKKGLLFLFGVTTLVVLSLAIRLLTVESVSAVDTDNDEFAGGDESYKRPACESTTGTRGCGDRQETACSFGTKVDC
ncbi:MAG: hypothetical protein R6U15_03105 [Candidatus Izemoplasmatales bacterium]